MTAHRDTRPATARQGPPVDALHADGRLPRQRGADHRARRRLLPRGRERQALPRRARGPVLGEHRLLLRRGDRAGGARPDARAALLHELDVRAPARDRARLRGRVARARRPQPRVLRLGRLGGGGVRVEARASVLPRPRGQAPPRASPARRPSGTTTRSSRTCARRAAATRRSRARRRTTGRRSARSR